MPIFTVQNAMAKFLTRLLATLGFGSQLTAAAQVAFEQQLATFQQLGFTLRDGVTTQDLLRWPEGPNAYMAEPYSLLYITLGQTIEREPYTPITDRCIHFDTEAIVDEDSYVSIVHDLARITRGDLVCTEVRSAVDFERGKAWVAFTANGRNVRWDLQVDDDWVDPEFFTKMITLVRELGLKGRYTYLDFGGQDMMIGYETEADLTTLKTATGLAITWLE